MTRFVDVPAMAKLIQAIELDEFIAQLADAIEANFVRWEEFDKAARFGAHNDEGVIELMPTSNAERYGFKYVNGHPDNIENDLFSVMGFGVLSDMHTGYPMLLSELTLATAMRTAATSVMVARALARKDSKVMAMIGNGAQAEFQAIGFHKVIGIMEIRAFDIDPESTEKLIRNLAEFEGIKVIHCNSVAEAVKGADIVTTITADKAMATIITPEMVEPGMHFNGVGGDCPGKTELAAGVLTQGKVFVEFEPQTRVEGDIQQMPADFPV
ncbi:MAG: ornithine cyclodeaminase, partial [Actinobacteria bacterium]|nr:ornithine cyclodeaminase [Actinomycetota bacterium]